MPVIVVGADTPLGEAIVAALLSRGGEIRAFAADPVRATTLRGRGAKVAVGDVSDGSHLTAAAHNAFTAVLVAEAILDGRELAFAADAGDALKTWTRAVGEAGVQRAIWVGELSPSVIAGSAPEVVIVRREGRPDHAVARAVADLNDAAKLEPED